MQSYFLTLLMVVISSLTLAVRLAKSPLSRSSLGKRLEPIPTQVTPALNQPLRLASEVSTPPVGMMLVQGMGPLTAFTKEGPPISDAGKSFTTSAPSSWALLISEMVPQPGDQATPRRLQVLAISSRSEERRVGK